MAIGRSEELTQVPSPIPDYPTPVPESAPRPVPVPEPMPDYPTPEPQPQEPRPQAPTPVPSPMPDYPTPEPQPQEPRPQFPMPVPEPNPDYPEYRIPNYEKRRPKKPYEEKIPPYKVLPPYEVPPPYKPAFTIEEIEITGEEKRVRKPRNVEVWYEDKQFYAGRRGRRSKSDIINNRYGMFSILDGEL